MVAPRLARLPIGATIVVALAVAAMIGLGLWQLSRAREKDALLARYRAAALLPATGWPAVPPPDDRLLFRRVEGFCLQVVGWSVSAGRSRAGEPGWRHVARCRTGGAEGPGMAVDAGWSRDWQVASAWRGGPVSGLVSVAPDTTTLIGRVGERLAGHQTVATPMLVLDRPAPGLQPSEWPDPDAIPHNHRSYAVQWFSFAAIALIIYVLALVKRGRAG